MLIGLTGNIGSGKSTALAYFEKAVFFVVNADQVGHALYEKEEVKKKVVDLFSEKILSDEKIDRKKLKEIVFKDPKELQKLNVLMHPLIKEEIKKITKGKEKAVVEAALLIEAGWECDKIILITIDKEEQIKRLLEKGKYNKEEINNILESQMPQEEKIVKADVILDNSGTKEELEENIRKLIKEL